MCALCRTDLYKEGGPFYGKDPGPCDKLMAEQRPASANGALRDSYGTKIDTTLVPYALIAYAAAGLNYGEIKYAARNFEKGHDERSLLASIDRHLRAMMNGETDDPDSGLPHLVMLTSSVAMLTHADATGVLIRNVPPQYMQANCGPFNVEDVSKKALTFMRRAANIQPEKWKKK